MILPAILGSTDRQERLLSQPSPEDRVKLPSENGYICLFVIRIQKSRYCIEIGSRVILPTMPGTASRIKLSTSGNYSQTWGNGQLHLRIAAFGELEAMPY